MAQNQVGKVYFGYKNVFDRIGDGQDRPYSADSNVNDFVIAVLNNGGSLTPTEIDALDVLVASLKSDNNWNKMIGLYPIVGGTAASHKVNLFTPGTFDLTFSGNWTHSSTGMKGDGSTAYALPGVTGVTSTDNNHMSMYITTNDDTNAIDIGSNIGVQRQIFSSGFEYASLRRFVSDFAILNNTLNGSLTAANADKQGIYIMSGNGVQNTSYKDGTAVMSAFDSTNIFYGNLTIGAGRADNGPITGYSPREFGFVSFGEDTLSSITGLNNAIQTFQTSLGR